MRILHCKILTVKSACMLLFILLSFSCKKNQANDPVVITGSHGIIPLPKKLNFTGEKILLNQEFTYVSNPSFPVASATAELLIKNILTSYKVSESVPTNGVGFQILMDKTLKDDAYQLSVTKTGIQIKACNEAGAFYGTQSLKQYLWTNTLGIKQTSLTLAGINISDEPKYMYRGFHLDVARHFFTKDYILKIIDWLAYYKFNKFQIHLSDDQGWRTESKKFPLLNSIGSWRVFDKYDSICIAKAASNADFKIDPRFIQLQNGVTKYGGYYTQQDIVEIISYAKSRFVEIIPEIDMPGHLSAAINAYPLLSCNGTSGWSTQFSYPLCPCSPEAIDLAFQIWDEAAEQFPSSIVHIGADEVDKSTWQSASLCPGFMAANNLHTLNDIQSLFVKNLQNHLEAKGKTVIAWDDVTDGTINSNLKIMYWRDWMTGAPAKAAANGNQIIFARWDLFYLSSPYSEDNLKSLLAFDISQNYSPQIVAKIIGFQGCMWTEEVPSEASFEAQVFPRLQALSEVNWSAVTDYYSFTSRMIPHRSYLLANHVNLKN